MLTGVNAVLYAISAFTPLCFWIDDHNNFVGVNGFLRYTCLGISIILLCVLCYRTIRAFKPSRRKETWIPIFVALLILLAYVMDDHVGSMKQPVAFLTIAIVICSTLYYNWLHFQFVREHEQALQTEPMPLPALPASGTLR